MDFPGFRAVGVQTVSGVVYVTLETTSETGCCPSCGVESTHVHSHYVRSLRDLPVLGRPVRLTILARRFRCLVSECRRKTFSERLEGMAQQHAQRTDRLTATLQSLILSSPTGARLAQQMGIETSARTLLRVVNHGEHVVQAPRCLGVDDFALRKGHSYGTLLCDLETGKPIDILPGRLAGPLTEWLKAHPGVEVIARDRATAYADAARAGAPNAVQVADRFHLVKNVSDALKDDIIQQRLAMGESLRAICRATGLSRVTVRKYVRSAGVPERAARRHHSNLDPFANYLRERWSVGCHNVRQLYREVVGLGYAGSESMLRTYVRAWREKPSCSSGEHQTRVNQSGHASAT
jgi:transposase